MMRRSLRNLYTRRLMQRVSFCDDDTLSQSAVVFAPHPDDETLGCGGAILRRRALGAPVWVVFLTDGRSSHSHLMPPDQLAQMRRQEAQRACVALNVPVDHVIHLDFPDGNLSDHLSEATERITAILAEINPAAIYLPHAADPPADHYAAHLSAMAARRVAAPDATAYGYPVWLWQQWPWVPLHACNRCERQMLWQNGRRMRAGWRFITELDTAVDIRVVHRQKQHALAHHHTQMDTLQPDWPTLTTVSQGQFLPLFFQPFEFFQEYK